MSRFFESIRIQDSKAWNIEYHERRVARTIRDVYGVDIDWSLRKFVTDAIPGAGLLKCKVVYDVNPLSIIFEPYTIKTIRTLKLVESDEIEYAYKNANREMLDSLFAKREGRDDVLIIKSGRVTDTSIANVVFMDEKGTWITPVDCLLRGTMRQVLLDSGQIFETRIKVDDLHRFKSFKVVNAMRGLELSESEVSNID